MSVVALQYRTVFNVKTASSFNSEIKTANYKSFLAFFNWVGLFLNFREVEPTVCYKLLLFLKNACATNFFL